MRDKDNNHDDLFDDDLFEDDPFAEFEQDAKESKDAKTNLNQRQESAANSQSPYDDPMNWLRENKAAAIAGTIFLVLVVYSFLPGSNESVENQPVAAIPSVASNQAATTNQAAPQVTESVATKQVSEDSSQPRLKDNQGPLQVNAGVSSTQLSRVNQGLATMVAESSQNGSEPLQDAGKSKVHELIEESFIELKSSIADLNKNTEALSQVVVSQGQEKLMIQQQLTTLTAALNRLTANLAHRATPALSGLAKAGVTSTPEVKPETVVPYQVEAVLPGRAYLRSPSGVLMTVRVGQDLPGAGKVSKIEPARARVTLNNGQFYQQDN